MVAPDRKTTIVSTKGQVILPKPVRERRHWGAGTRLVVEDTPDGVLLRAASDFQPTRPDDVYASLPSPAKPKSIDEMKAGVLAEAKRRHDRD